MNRRGFLGSLAALVGAKVIADSMPDAAPPAPLPVMTSGYVNTDLNGANTYWNITTNAANSNYVYLDYAAHVRGEGIRWNYTTGIRS